MNTQGNVRPIYVVPAEQAAGDASRLSLTSAVAFLWGSRFWLLLFALLGIAGGVALDLLETRIYESTTLLSAAQPDRAGALGNITSQLGGLASLAGASLGPTNTAKTESRAVLDSPGFLGSFITSHNLLPILYFKIWDPQTKNWTTSDPAKVPTLARAVRYFSTRILTVEDDRKTGLVTVGIRWRDRQLAADWANQIVADLNQTMRSRAIIESQGSVAYLDGVLRKGGVPDVEQQAMYGLIQTQLATAMVANVRKDYAFKVLDPAIPADPDRFVRPDIVVLVAGGMLGSMIFGLLARVLLGPRLQKLWSDYRDRRSSL